MKRFTAMTTVALLLAAAGCGGGPSSPSDVVTAAAREVLEGSPAKACGYYTADGRASVADAGETCEDAFLKGAVAAKAFGITADSLKVVDETVTGDRATVTVDSDYGKSTTRLVKQGDAWLIDEEGG